MFETMRKVFGPVAVSVIIGAIALVFVFYGVYNPRSRGGLGGGSVAATVDGESISVQDFSREYSQRVEFYQNMMKGKVDPGLLKQLGLRRQVLEDLIRRKVMLLEAKRLGLTVSDDETRAKIAEMPYFQRDGRFDRTMYEQVLRQNQYSPAGFEDLMRQDILRAQFGEFLRGRVHVSDKELEKEFLVSEDRRQVEYVVISREAVRKLLTVSEKEIDTFLKEPANLEAAKTYYDGHKFSYMKPLPKKPAPKAGEKPAAPKEPEYFPFEQVSRKVAAEVLRDRRGEEIVKMSRELANGLLAAAKSGPAALGAEARKKGLELKTSEKFNRLAANVDGLSAPELVNDAFKDASPLATEPKLYEVPPGSFVVARGLKAFAPNQAEFAKNREKLGAELRARKEQALAEQWMGEARARAKIAINDELVKEDEGAL